MSRSEFVVGFGYFLGMLVPVTFAAWVLTRSAFGHLTGVPRFLCGSLLIVAGIIAVHMIPGVLGILSRPAVLVVSILGAAIVFTLARRSEPAEPDHADEVFDEPEGPAAWLAAAIVLGAAVYILGYAIVARNQIIDTTDAVWFHIPGLARWMQTKSFWDVGGTWLPEWAFGHYPQNGNVVQLSVVLPWNNDSFVRFVSIPFLGLAGLSAYALARELRAPRSAAAATAAVYCLIPVSMRHALRAAQTDTILFAAFGIGVLFLLRSSRSGSVRELVLAGLGLGIAFGTKWYGVTYVPIVILVWAVAMLVARRPFRRILSQGAALMGIVFASGGFWLVRNLVKSGSPLFPAKVAVGGFTIFDAPPSHVLENGGYSIGHYLDQPEIVRRIIVPPLVRWFAVSGIVLAAALVVLGAIVLIRRRAHGESGRTLALCVGGVLLLIAYAFTPYSAFGPKGHPDFAAAGARYALPALLLAAAVAAWSATLVRGLWRTGFVAVAGLCALESVRRTAARPEFSITPRLVVFGIVAAGLLVLVWAARNRLARWKAPARTRATAAIALLAVAALAAGAAGYRQQRAYNLTRYGPADPVFAWVERNAPSGHRIGLAGRYPYTADALPPPLPLFGPRLRNKVEYVGPTVRGLLREYRSQESFVAALTRGDYELLVVALGDPPQPTAVQEEWARSAGFVEVARSPRLVLLARNA